MFKEEFLNKTKELGTTITEEMLNKLDTYYHILKEENNKYNLTRIIEEDAV